MLIEELRDELVRLAREDGELRGRLETDGALEGGRNSLMTIVQRRNGDRLAQIVDAFGWPGVGLVGDDGADAAWLLCKHATEQPDLQRRMLPLVEAAVARGDVPAWHAATLLDGIRYHEGRPQVYGTVWGWDPQGRMEPWQIEEEGAVDERRANVGLPPLAQQREGMERHGGAPPDDPESALRDAEEWARAVGWR